MISKNKAGNRFFTFEAISEKYSDLWEGQYVGMDRGAKEIVYIDEDEVEHRFSYKE